MKFKENEIKTPKVVGIIELITVTYSTASLAACEKERKSRNTTVKWSMDLVFPWFISHHLVHHISNMSIQVTHIDKMGYLYCELVIDCVVVVVD